MKRSSWKKPKNYPKIRRKRYNRLTRVGDLLKAFSYGEGAEERGGWGKTAPHVRLSIKQTISISSVEVGAHDDPRKIKIKAKISIEYSFSIVGTGVLDCPDMQTAIDMLRPVI